MKDHIYQRVLEIAEFLVAAEATVRQAANAFGVSKSTVHKDLTERLPIVNPQLAEQVRNILDINKAERHIRGGEATRKKYLDISS
ncbi:MAG TPA: sporulation transcriptional regulator SpoIIID [Firmicutes bacterium]|jgi:putative DeoR family transcriptional regulator (stage III sporulation protein D)|nr:sporulation transcriptional regulator SpoIIID [Bacillota bacterium]